MLCYSSSVIGPLQASPALGLPPTLSPNWLPAPRSRFAICMCDARGVDGIDIAEAASEARNVLDEEKQRKMDLLFAAPPPIDGETGETTTNDLAWISSRDKMVGQLESSALLNLDEASGLWPKYLPPKSNRATDNDMYFVDELSCVGCTWCADVARSTFRMMTDDNSYGQARVVQQGGDSEEVVQEAIACCPADCIHTCTRDELELLEEYRSLGYTDDLLARFQTRRLMGEGEGGGSFAAPHWRDPIVHQSWRKGEKYIKSRRVKLEDPLLHHSGEKSSMSLIGMDDQKVNDSPSPTYQDGTVVGKYTGSTTSPTELPFTAMEQEKSEVERQDDGKEDAETLEAPTEYLKAVGDAKASKENPWD